MKPDKWKETLSVILSAALALILFLVLLLLLQWNIILCMALATAAYISLSLLLRPAAASVRSKLSPWPTESSSMNGSQKQETTTTGMLKAVRQIYEQPLLNECRDLITRAGNILKYLTDNPEKIPAARRYIDYYQETAANVLEHYVELKNTGLSTVETEKILRSTPGKHLHPQGRIRPAVRETDAERTNRHGGGSEASEKHTEIRNRYTYRERTGNIQMKKKLIGLVLLIVIMIVIGVIYFISGRAPKIVSVDGYVGGEKIELLEDAEVQAIFKEKYGVQADYSRAGSLDMMTADMEGMDYLFPSSSIAEEYYEDLHGSPQQSEIVLNTPIVLYTHRSVLDAFDSHGLITQSGSSYYVDMPKLVELIQNDTAWADIGLPELYGTISVDTTDPSSSNSEYVLRAARQRAERRPDADRRKSATDPAAARRHFRETGLHGDLIIRPVQSVPPHGRGGQADHRGYESQLIEYAALYPDQYESMKDDIVMLYPAPTVWSTHVFIALDDNGQLLLNALLDEDVQKLAWEKHGFRTGNYTTVSESEDLTAVGVADDITQVTQVPSYDVMKVIIEQLQ